MSKQGNVGGAFSCASNPLSRTANLLSRMEDEENENDGRSPNALLPKIISFVKRLLRDAADSAHDRLT